MDGFSVCYGILTPRLIIHGKNFALSETPQNHTPPKKHKTKRGKKQLPPQMPNFEYFQIMSVKEQDLGWNALYTL